VAIRHDQQQVPVFPGRHVAVLTRGWLQLAFDLLLKTVEASGFAEQRSQRLGFAQQGGGRSGR